MIDPQFYYQFMSGNILMTNTFMQDNVNNLGKFFDGQFLIIFIIKDPCIYFERIQNVTMNINFIQNNSLLCNFFLSEFLIF